MTTVADTRALDAAYRPFPAFAAWQARTTVESPRWSALVTRLKEAKAAAATLTARALEVAKRAAAFDTGALENLYETDRGFTYSVAFETGAWELGLIERGEQVRPLFEAQMRAYDLVLSLATGSEPVSEAAIRELHSVICAAQDTYQVMTAVGPQSQPLPKGVYKALPNHVGTRKGEDHAYAPVDLTPAEMHRLVQELRTEDFLAAHPIQQAAYAHYCFVAIHPFADGNGRVARALASLYTYRATSAPIIILSEDKPRYLDALAEADEGNEQAFVTLLLHQGTNTLQLIADELEDDGSSSSFEEALADLQSITFVNDGLPVSEVDRRGWRLTGEFRDALTQLIESESAFKGEISVADWPSETAPGWGMRPLQTNRTPVILISLEAIEPGLGRVAKNFFTHLPIGHDQQDEVIITGPEGWTVKASLDELASESGFLKLRMRAKARTVMAELIAELAEVVKANRNHGNSQTTS